MNERISYIVGMPKDRIVLMPYSLVKVKDRTFKGHASYFSLFTVHLQVFL
jgi:hypothetical protein